jgi:PST family polysaccharide transporter
MFVLTGLGMALRSGTQISVIILSSRYFTPEEVGLAAILFGTYHLLWNWFETAIIQTYYQLSQNHTGQYENIRSMTLASCLIVCAAIIVLFPIYERWLPGQGLIVISILVSIVAMRALGVLNNAELLKQLKMRIQVPIEQLTYVTGFLGALWLCIQYDMGPLYMILGMLFSSMLSTVLLKVFTYSPGVKGIRFDRSTTKDILSIFSGYFFGSGLNSFVREANILFIGVLLTSTAAGYYSRAAMIYMIGAYTLGQLFDRLLTPMMRRNISDSANNTMLFEISTLFMWIFCIPFSVILFMNSNDLIIALLGDDWVPATPILQVLSVAFAFRVLMKVNEATLRAYGEAWRRVRYYLVWVGLLIVMAYPASKIHLAGFAVAEVAGVTAFYLLSLNASMRCAGVTWASQLKWCWVVIFPVLAVIQTQKMVEGFESKPLALLLIGGVAVIVCCVTFVGTLRARFGSINVIYVLR